MISVSECFERIGIGSEKNLEDGDAFFITFPRIRHFKKLTIQIAFLEVYLNPCDQTKI
jgi:hypothetical protein